MAEGYIFDFEKLDVYKKSMGYANRVFALTRDLSRNAQYSLGDQFRRAALSICNNIAEGSGSSTPSAKRQYYRIALNSARECIPMISIAQEHGEISNKDASGLRDECVIVCRMLFKLIVSVH